MICKYHQKESTKLKFRLFLLDSGRGEGRVSTSSTRFHRIAKRLCYNLPVISPTRRRCALLSLLFIALAGCSHLPQNNDPKAMAQWKARYGDNDTSSQVLNTTPRDDLGRVVELKATPKRVLVLGPGATEMVYALGLQGKIVGRDSASDFPAEAQKLPIIGDFNGPNIERAVAQNPDFVLIQGETYDRERIDGWQKQLGAPVAAIAATTLKGVQADARKIAVWLGRKNVKPDAEFFNWPPGFSGGGSYGPDDTAVFEVERKPLWVAGQKTLINDLMYESAMKNAVSFSSYKQLNLEALLAKPPHYYIVSTTRLKTIDDMKTKFATERNRVLDELRREPGLKSLECIRKGRVLIVPADWVLRPGPRMGLGLSALSKQKRKYQEVDLARGAARERALIEQRRKNREAG